MEGNMKAIEADFGINLKDITLGDITVKFGDVEYLFTAESGLWKTNVSAQNVDELDIEEAKGQAKHKGKKQKVDLEEQQMSLEEMRSQILVYEKQIANTKEKIEIVDGSISKMREQLKKTKQENEDLMNEYIVEFLETDLLSQKAKEITQVQKKIDEENRKEV